MSGDSGRIGGAIRRHRRWRPAARHSHPRALVHSPDRSRNRSATRLGRGPKGVYPTLVGSAGAAPNIGILPEALPWVAAALGRPSEGAEKRRRHSDVHNSEGGRSGGGLRREGGREDQR